MIKGYYRLVTGRSGRPKRYATLEEIPADLRELYPVAYVEEIVDEIIPEPSSEQINFTEGEPISGEKEAEVSVPRPEKKTKRRARAPKKPGIEVTPITSTNDATYLFTEGEPIEGEDPKDIGIPGRPIQKPLYLSEEEPAASKEPQEPKETPSEVKDDKDIAKEEKKAKKGAPEDLNYLRRYTRRRHFMEPSEEPNLTNEEVPQPEEEEVETPSETTPSDVNVESELADILYLRCRSNAELRILAERNKVRDILGLRRQELIFRIMRSEYAKYGYRLVKGVVDIVLVRGKRCGFLRKPERNYEMCDDDLYLSPAQITRFQLEKGDTVYGVTRRRRQREKSDPVIKVAAVNYMGPNSKEGHTPFEELVPEFAAKRYFMEYDKDDVSTRIMDLISPIGRGQRGLIVAPPRAGKTMLLKAIANALSHNAPEAELIMLLIDERPEEVTDMKNEVRGEVISSTFDEPSERHLAIAEMVLEKAKRLVEHGRDVIILLDSITRLARAYNNAQKNSGKILSGGMDASALQKPKRFFGSARSIEGGGSLTIVATALVETGSRMDDLIFEEFKGTGNMECVLDRRIGEKRVFPAIDIDRSGTRREELLFEPLELKKVWGLRQLLSGINPLAKIERLIDLVKSTSSNAELLMMIKER